MKKFFTTLAMSFAFVLAACGGQSAHAANIPDEYVCNGGTNLCNLAMQTTVTPATTAQLTQLQALPSFAAYFVQVSGNFATGLGTYVNTSLVTMVCSYSTLTVSPFNSGASYYSDPGCTIYAGISARSQH